MGLGAIFGQAGDLFAQFRAAGVSTDDVNVDPSALRESIQNGAIGAFLGLAAPAITSAIGGWLGARGRNENRWRGATADR